MSQLLKKEFMGIAIVFAVLLFCVQAHAEVTGGITGKATGADGAPLVGYTIQIERQNIKWSAHTKTNKKGEYIYIGIIPDSYKITLVDPNGKAIYFQGIPVNVGDPAVVDFDMAKIHKEAQKTAEEDPNYQKQVEAQKESANLREVFEQGRVLYNQKHYVEAAAEYEKALPLAKDRNVAIILGQLADTWTKAASIETDPDKRKEDQTTALDYYNKVLAIAPNDATLHGSLGTLYGAMGRSDDAMAEFKKAAELNPTHAAGYYFSLGAMLVNSGKMDDAAVALKKSTEIDPSSSLAWYWYGMALLGKATAKPDGTMVPAPGTIEAFQTYLKLDPNGAHAAEVQATIDMLSGKTSLEYKKSKK